MVNKTWFLQEEAGTSGRQMDYGMSSVTKAQDAMGAHGRGT